MEMINAVGRRKTAVARVYVKKGNGSILVNGKDYKEYFPAIHIQGKVIEPITAVNVTGIYDINVNVNGGGIKGQAEAVRLGISRCLVKINDEEFRPILKVQKLLTRDPRVVERKKYGQPKARKGFQFSKR